MLEKMKEIIAEFSEFNPEEINEETTLRGDLGLNSFDLVNMTVMIEEEYGVEIKETKLPVLHTVGDIMKYIEKNK